MNEYIRVSHVLSPFSGLDKIDPLIVQKAAERGTRVHNHCFSLMKGMNPFFTHEEDKGYYDSFLKWYDGSVMNIENRFYDNDLMLTGEIDLLMKSGDHYIIYDLKTSSKPSKTWPLQGAAYAYLAEKSGFSISKIEFIHLKKDGKSPRTYVYEKEKYFDIFMHCYKTYKYFYSGVKNEHDGED